MTIYVECKPDSILVATVLSIGKGELDHQRGKYRVCSHLEAHRDSCGMIDEEPWGPQPSYMNRMQLKLDLPEFSLKLLYDRRRSNYLVVVSPRLEEWVIKAAKEINVDVVKKYHLPDNSRKLQQEIIARLGQFESLVRDLKRSDRLKNLKRLLEGRK